jgi:hypothetical protein
VSSRIFDSSFHCEKVHDEWKGRTAGGCNNTEAIGNNPQFLLTITAPTQLYIFLSQKETRGTGKDELAIGVTVLKLKGKRLTRQYYGNEKAWSPTFMSLRYAPPVSPSSPVCVWGWC